MKQSVIILVLIIIFVSIFSFFKNKESVLVSLIPTPTDIFTLYKKTEKQVQIARVVTLDEAVFDLYVYEIDISVPEGTKQRFVSAQHLNKQELDQKKDALLKTHNWTPFKSQDVLFVQIQPEGFKNETQLLNKRQKIEAKIDRALGSKNLGEWFAGDIGPGGANMLYTVSGIDASMQVILGVLSQNNLNNNVLIGRRVMTNADDWFYEVIYPLDYSGDFNTM